MEGSCADLHLTAKNTGHTKVSIAYRHELFELRATITVAAYRPLKANLILLLHLNKLLYTVSIKSGCNIL